MKLLVKKTITMPLGLKIAGIISKAAFLEPPFGGQEGYLFAFVYLIEAPLQVFFTCKFLFSPFL